MIRRFETKEGRKKEREKVGKLQDAIVKPITTERYHQMFQQFLSFTNLTKARRHADPNVVDPVLADFIESLWCDGEPKSYANYAVAAVQFYVPECKRHLTRSWKLVSTWNKIEMPARVVPISAEVLLAIAGVFQKWQWRRLSLMLVVAYSTFLRTGEIFRIRRENVVLGHHGHPAVIFLQDTKTAQRKQILWEKVLVKEPLALLCLEALCEDWPKPQLLIQESIFQFRKIWKDSIEALQLTQWKILPYSIRRGGATSAYKRGMSFEELMQQGRWSNVATARIYLDEGLQEMQSFSLKPPTRALIQQAISVFHRCKPAGDAWRGKLRGSGSKLSS